MSIQKKKLKKYEDWNVVLYYFKSNIFHEEVQPNKTLCDKTNKQ